MSAIDFSKITKTLDGYDCHYFGVRESHGTKLHCFGVWTGYGCCESAYDEQGRHLVWCHDKTCWNVSASLPFQIIAPPKIVEVTRWITYHRDDNGDIGCRYHSYDPDGKQLDGFIGVEKVTKRFEVPND